MRDRSIPFVSQKALQIFYKGRPMKKQYVADFICYSTLLVEIKAADYLTSKDESQMLNYLKATGLQVGVLINFGARGRFEWKRMVLTQHGVIDPEENVD